MEVEIGMQVATTSSGAGHPSAGPRTLAHPCARAQATTSALWRPARGSIPLAPICALIALLLLGGCVSRPRPVATDDRYAPLVEGPNMLIVRGEDVREKPLTPEPGDVWADIVPDREQALAEATPPKGAKGTKGTVRTGVGQGKEAATAITTPLEADWPVPQAAQAAAARTVPADGTMPPATAPTDAKPATPALGKPAAATGAGKAVAATSEGKAPGNTMAAAAPAGAAVQGNAPPAPTNEGKPTTMAMAAGPAASAAPTASAAARGREVQLAAAGSPAEAEATWARLAERYPALLRGRSPIVRQGEANGRTVWRLRTGGFATAGEASSFCDRLRGAGASCWVASHI